MKKLALLLIRLYQKTLSYDHGYMGKIFPNKRYCKHLPSCSEYTYQAIDKFGVIKGVYLGFFRVLRCNPFKKECSYEPVPMKFSLKIWK